MNRLDGDFQGDWNFQARFTEHQKEIATKAMRVEFAPVEDDLKRNTDLILRSVVPLKNGLHMRISARVRRRIHLTRYAGQFTIRDRRPTGVATEIDKMRLGDGDVFVYGFESQTCADGCEHGPGQCRLDPWLIGNLHILREYDADGGYREIRTNKGLYGSQLAAFYLSDMPLGFVIDAHNVTAVDRTAPWGECRNANWTDKTKRMRIGPCGGSYVTPLNDDLEPAAGKFRRCLSCGFTWKSGWIMPLTKQGDEPLATTTQPLGA